MYKLLVGLTVALVVLTAVVSGGPTEGKKGKWKQMKNMTCKGEAMDLKPYFVGKKECYTEIAGTSTSTAKPKDEEAKKEMVKKWKENEMCIDVCTWKKQKMLNADGTYNADEAEKSLKAVFPAAVQASLKKAFDECATANSKSFSLDNKCAGYKAFKDCKVKKFMEICEIKKGDQSEESN